MGPMKEITPDRKAVLPYLKRTIQEKENEGVQTKSMEICEDEEGVPPTYLDASPSMQFHYTCTPHYLQSMTVFSGISGTTVVGFQWGHALLSNKMDVWADNGKGQLRRCLSVPMENEYKVEHLQFVPTQRVLVGACNDMSLRVFTDITQKMRVLYQASCPAFVICMHFCPDTNQLLTGSMGLIAFWGFKTSPDIPLGLVRVLDWNCCSLSQNTLVGGLVTEPQTSSVYALCSNRLKVFEHTGQRELLQFKGCSRGRLQCIAADEVHRCIYSGDACGFVQIWSRDIAGLLHEFRAHTHPVSSLLLRSDTGSFLTACTGGWVKEWSSGGNLLLKLYVDEPGGVRSLSLLGKDCLLCQSPSSMVVWQLCGLYRLYNDTGGDLQITQRVERGRDRAWFLSVTDYRMATLLCPVSGQLLLLSWPLPHLENALGFAYNPSREELFVAYGTPEVLVLDTSKSPYLAKHLICTSADYDDSVTCVEGVEVDVAEWPGVNYLVFSGHRSGKLHLLSPAELHCQVDQEHSGAITQSSSLPGRVPVLCCYGTDKQFSVWSVRLETEGVRLILNTRVSCASTPLLSRLLPGWVCAISPHHNLLLLSLSGGKDVERKRNRAEPVCCLDYCPLLDLLALCGPGGTVEIWDCTGNMLSEIRLGSAVSQVCFANTRGDILVSFRGSVYLLPSLHFLPVRLLKALPEQDSDEEIPEYPIPFLPKAPGSYDVSRVPRLHPGPEGNMSITIHLVNTVTEKAKVSLLSLKKKLNVTPKSATLKVVEWPAPAGEREEVVEDVADCNLTPLMALAAETEHDMLVWPVAPDGYLPNSVLRGHGQKQEKPALLDPNAQVFQLKFREETDIRTSSQTSDILSLPKAASSIQHLHFPLPKIIWDDPVTDSEPEDDVMDEHENLKTTTQNLLDNLLQADSHMSDKHSWALQELIQSNSLNPELKQIVKKSLLDQAHSGLPKWQQLQNWETLASLNLICEGDQSLLALPLLNPHPEMRNLAQHILKTVFNITDKETLQNELQKHMTQKQIKELLDQLNEDLELIVDVDRRSEAQKTKENLPLPHVTPPLPHVTPPLPLVTPPLPLVTPPLPNVTPPLPLVTPPLPLVTPPLPHVSPPLPLVTPSLPHLSPPLPHVTPPLPLLTPPHPHVTPPLPLVTPPLQLVTPPLPLVTPPLPLETSTQPPVTPTLRPESLTLYPETLTLHPETLTLRPETSITCTTPITQQSVLSVIDVPDQDQEKTQRKANLPCVRQPSVRELPHVEMKRSKALVVQADVHEKKRHSFLPPVSPPCEARQHIHLKSSHLRETQRSVVEIKKQTALLRDDPLMYLYSKSRSDIPSALGLGQLPSQQTSSLQTLLSPSRHPEYCRIQPSCGEGDADWRASLHKLVSLYGFRSKDALSYSPGYQAPPASRIPSEAMSPVFQVPKPPSRPPGQCALGQRVLHRTQLRGTWERTPTQFQHEVSLPWQLSSYTLSAQGKSRYGRLELDWVRSPDRDFTAPRVPASLTPACQAL